jgi:hypothetical protein
MISRDRERERDIEREKEINRRRYSCVNAC